MEQLPLPPVDGDATDDAPAQAELPFGDADQQPVPFALTARARRTVAPREVPPLRVVGAPAGGTPTRPGRSVLAPALGGLDAPEEPEGQEAGDTRPARARALRRAGARPAAIARQLGVDPLLVRAWTDGVRGVAHVTAVPVTVGDGDLAAAEDAARRAAFASSRTGTRTRARVRLAAEPHLAGGLGVLAATAEAEPDGVTVTTRDERVAAAVVRWVAEVLDVAPQRWRVVLRLGERAAADLARHRWAAATGLPPERVRTTRWAGTAEADAEEVRLRLADPVVAAAIAGWCDALLDDPEEASF